jgi:general secretion pathway protein D
VLVEVMLAEVLLSDTSIRRELVHLRRSADNAGSTRTTGRLGRLARYTFGCRAAADAYPAGSLCNSSTGPAWRLRAVLTALGRDGRAQVLASPQVMVLDNQKAQIKVGDRISVQTLTQTGSQHRLGRD